jgi:beta-N-acetylhexosaminidase
MKSRRFIHFVLAVLLFASMLWRAPVAYAQSQVQAILNSMSPQERVGQLFLVTFRGTSVAPDSKIYDLIVNRHIGGVVLLAENDNFVDAPETILSAYQLTSDLQNLEWEATHSLSPAESTNEYVPLFVGISQDGDGARHDQILSGLTPTPSLMAVGATWNVSQSEQVGTVLGSELSAIGFNLIVGPSLDVVESPNPSALSDLGTSVFGGDPFWVAKMGGAFIKGIHEGSKNRMVVITKHFPGRGDSDRQLGEEVATVRKSLEALKQVELFPFFAVASATDPALNADGFLVSHIRYQGFQGNIRATTRPVSLDSSALPAILALPEFQGWRANGGLVVSDALGSNAVRAFYSQGGENFSLRSVARDAFQAGNDLMYLGNIKSDLGTDITYESTAEILDFFSQEYVSDPAFAQRVDAAVTRILAKKLGLYGGNFSVSNVISSILGLGFTGESQQVKFEVASNAATLISPDPQELNALLPAPPNPSDRIVFLTDASTAQQCSTCVSKDALAADALQKAVDRLYGQGGSGQVFNSRMSSFSFREVELFLNGESETNIESALERATWVVVSLADVNNNQLSLLRRFFSERPNLIRNKNVILFSFTAPYYLDATDISKLTAYYALYSKQPAFVDVAARLLFQQIAPGASPVSIPAVGYDLIAALSPEPSQVIPLALDISAPELTATPDLLALPATALPLFKIGDSIAVRAGPILDTNGRLVPDGTIARFTMSTRESGGGVLQQVDAPTVDGIARALFVIDKPGFVEIRVMSEPALVSDALQFDASAAGVAVTVIAPTTIVTPTTTAPSPTPTIENDLVTPEGYPRLGGWMLAVLALAGGAVLVFWAANILVATRWALRFTLCAVIGGLISYNYLALGFPGAAAWIASGGGTFGVLILIFSGEVLGICAAWAWMRAGLAGKGRE